MTNDEAEVFRRSRPVCIAVVDAASVTEAARHLHVSPGGVSLAIKELERSLDVQLTIRRPGKGVMVTPAGRWVYQHAQAVIAGANEISSVAQIVRGELAGPLRVGCFSTLSPWLFPRIAAHFAERYPGIDVHLHEGESYELQSLLAEGALDVVLLYSNRMIPGMVGEEIMPVRMQLAFAPTHRLASMEEVQLSELENETAILLGIHPGSGPVEMMLKAAGIQPKVGWRSNNIETIRSMVARGLGYTIIMGRPFGDFSYDGFPLAYRRIAGDVPNISVVVAYPQGAKPTAKARELINFCQEEFRGEGEGFRKELRPAEGMGLL